MNIEIVCHGFALTDAIERHVYARLQGLLSRHGEHLTEVRVTLGDVNGPRGGVDKFCRLIVDLSAKRTICVEKTAEDLYQAVSDCSDAANRSVRDSIARSRDRRRRLDVTMAS